MRGDGRSRHVAVVPDNVINPPAGGDAGPLVALEQAGWGIVALGPPELVPEARAAWLEAIVEQVVTFLDDDYDVALMAADDAETGAFVRALAATGRAVTRMLPETGIAEGS
jgi:hypothetical protein